LNRKVNELAQVLRDTNNTIQTKKINSVHLFFDYETDMIVGMLSVLKLGYCYVPLATHDPIERLNFILEDSEGSIILTNNTKLTQALAIKDYYQGDLLILNISKVQPIEQFKYSKKLSIAPSQLAYILYTSGSTGKPKGVMQNHRNVMHFIRNYTNNLRISVDDNLTGFSSYTFDSSIMSIYGALLNGSIRMLFLLDFPLKIRKYLLLIPKELWFKMAKFGSWFFAVTILQ